MIRSDGVERVTEQLRPRSSGCVLGVFVATPCGPSRLLLPFHALTEGAHAAAQGPAQPRQFARAEEEQEDEDDDEKLWQAHAHADASDDVSAIIGAQRREGQM